MEWCDNNQWQNLERRKQPLYNSIPRCYDLIILGCKWQTFVSLPNSLVDCVPVSPPCCIMKCMTQWNISWFYFILFCVLMFLSLYCLLGHFSLLLNWLPSLPNACDNKEFGIFLSLLCFTLLLRPTGDQWPVLTILWFFC